jgi:UDP-N-acetylglucosamine--N-acetylmuramyl-(pentapeptide) pyrophosphoryl-undecaprenol N-acetylglucosamine transferase
LKKRGHEVFFVGTERGMEQRLVPAAGFELRHIEIGGLNRVSFLRKVTTLSRLPFVTAGSFRFANDVNAVFSMGGYVAGPPVMAALLKRKPVVVMEPNAIPGFTNRRIARFVARALVNFPETVRYFPKERTELTGMPVRAEFFEIQPRTLTDTLNVLVTGGSQGSQALNRALRESWPVFRQRGLRVRIVHQTGSAQFEMVRAEFGNSGIDGVVVPFLSDMPAAFAQADLVVCRSGAGTVSELAAAGKPSILVPFPLAADDHQTRNAEAMTNGGGACMLREAQMSGERLVELIEKAIDQLGEMSEAARRLARPGAAERAAEILEEEAAANE